MRSKLTILAMMFIALVSCNTGSETSVSFHVEDTQLYPEAVLMTKDSIYKQALTSNNSTTFTLPEKFEPATVLCFSDKNMFYCTLNREKALIFP